MKRTIVITFGAIAAGILVLGGQFYWNNLRGIGPAVQGPPEIPGVPATVKNTTGMQLELPDGFSISLFAKDLPGARVMAFDTFDNLWVSQTPEGLISLLEIHDGEVVNQNAVFRNLRRPHGLAFDPENPFALYIAEEHRVSRVAIYSEGELEKITDLPTGDGHNTRTIGFGPDGRLYVSIGSSCNVCHESDSRRAAIISMSPDGSGVKDYARGLRNAVFFVWDLTGRIWATEMGRDLLGDDIPPDEINVIDQLSGSPGKDSTLNFGWPICYGKNIHDAEFDKNTYFRNPCMEPFETPSHIDLQAHSAPLGLVFIPQSWGSEYAGDLLVAFHGSWNRSVPTGYKIVRIKLDASGNYEGIEDFIYGWLTEDGAIGRPVDLKFGSDDALYVSDDKAGVIYRVTRI